MVQKTGKPWPGETLDMCEYCSHWLLLSSLWQGGVPIAMNCWHDEISPLSCDISRELCLWKVNSPLPRENRDLAAAPHRWEQTAPEETSTPMFGPPAHEQARRQCWFHKSTAIPGQGSKGCTSALLHCCLLPYHEAMLHGLSPILSMVFFTKNFVWTIISAWKKWFELAIISQQFRSYKHPYLCKNTKAIRNNVPFSNKYFGGDDLGLQSGIFNHSLQLDFPEENQSSWTWRRIYPTGKKEYITYR